MTIPSVHEALMMMMMVAPVDLTDKYRRHAVFLAWLLMWERSPHEPLHMVIKH